MPGLNRRLCISCGVASLQANGDAADALIDAADKALYQAKQLGRNGVVAAAAAQAWAA